MTGRPPDGSAPPDFRWRGILLPAYGPTAVASLGYGAVAPVVALAAIEIGATDATAALIVGLAAIGQLCADLPAGALAAKIGERRALIAAGLVDAAAMATAFYARSLAVLAVAIFVSGIAAAVFNLARHAWMTEVIPPKFRARALSALGGTFRIGLFVGPFIAAGLIAVADLRAVFAFAMATGLAATALTLTMRELPSTAPSTAVNTRVGAASDQRSDRPTVASVLNRHRNVLLTAGTGILLLCAVRACRQSILPLWADSHGIDASHISLIFGISSGVELLLVYPGGAIMDRWGRAFVAAPAVAVMGAALMLLPLTDTASGIGAVACLFALGSGLSSGIVFTLGADLAPVAGRSQFLGAWRLFADLGNMAGPLMIPLATLVGPLGVAAYLLAGMAAVGAGWIGYWIPRSIQPRK